VRARREREKACKTERDSERGPENEQQRERKREQIYIFFEQYK